MLPSLPSSTTVPWTPDTGRVVRTRAPLRLGLGGGGTDLSPFCDRFGGVVLNVTIDRFVEALVEPSPDGLVHFVDHTVGASWHGSPDEATSPAIDRLTLHAGVYRRFVRDVAAGHPFPVTLTTRSELPARSGLGASSTLVVAMAAALGETCGVTLPPPAMARLAVEVERKELGLPGGRQDQYAAAIGGLNLFQFDGTDRVSITPVQMRTDVLAQLEDSLLLFHSGVARESNSIIDHQQREMSAYGSETLDAMHELKACALAMHAGLLAGDLDAFHAAMNRSWSAKKRTAPEVTNDVIDAICDTALGAGALSGKVSGAGGGGFVALFVAPSKRDRVVRALAPFNGRVVPCRFTTTGAEVSRSA